MDKKCNKCNTVKSINKFHIQKTGKFGVRSVCKECRNIKKKSKRCKQCGKDMRKVSNYCSVSCKDAFWRENNYEKYYAVNRKWKDANHSVRLIKSRKAYHKNPGKYIDKSVAYRLQKERAMPVWLSEEQRNKIKAIYESCPKEYHVDHIVPLRGRNVCGLHVPWNLQHLPKIENLKKSNQYRNDISMKQIV